MAPIDKKARIYMLGDFMKGRDKVIHDPFDVSSVECVGRLNSDTVSLQEDLNSFRICFERLYIACEDFYFHVNEKRLCWPWTASLCCRFVDVMRTNKTRIFLHKLHDPCTSRMTKCNKSDVRERFVDSSEWRFVEGLRMNVPQCLLTIRHKNERRWNVQATRSSPSRLA